MLREVYEYRFFHSNRFQVKLDYQITFRDFCELSKFYHQKTRINLKTPGSILVYK